MWYETLLPKIINMSITGSIVIVIVLLLRLILRKAPRIFSYSLWLVVLFRLLVPCTLSAEFSLLGLLDVPVTEEGSIEYIPNDVVSNPFPKVDFLVEDATALVNSTLPQGWEQVNDKPLAELFALATVVWLAGVWVLLGISLHSMGKLRRSLRGARVLRENIYIAENLDTPLVVGILRPRIYLPTALSRAEQDYVLLHEDHHIRRGDHVAKLLAFGALCIHWFNPLVWAAFRLSDRDMEMSCDEAVARDLDGNMRCDYSQTLLRLASGRRSVAGGPLCFCEGDPKVRIRNILKWKRPKRHTWIICTSICLLLCASLLTDPVFAVETAQPFTGRIHLTLPEGYDYTLLDDPSFTRGRRNIVVYMESAEYAISAGCISMDFAPAVYYGDDADYTTTITLNDGQRAKIHYNSAGVFIRMNYQTDELGGFCVLGHNSNRWTEAERSAFMRLMEQITITGPVRYSVFDLSEGSHLSVPVRELEQNALWTDEGYCYIALTGAQGQVTISLYEAYSDRLVETIRVEDAAREDHHVFTGLTARKEYYLVVTGADDASITIFS